jgi:hypothetical protein
VADGEERSARRGFRQCTVTAREFRRVFEDAPKSIPAIEDNGHKIPASPCYGKKIPAMMESNGTPRVSKKRVFRKRERNETKKRSFFGLRVSFFFFLKNEKV